MLWAPVHIQQEPSATCCILKMDALVALWIRTRPTWGLVGRLADFHVISKPRDFAWILKRLKILRLFTCSIKELKRQRREGRRKRGKWEWGRRGNSTMWGVKRSQRQHSDWWQQPFFNLWRTGLCVCHVFYIKVALKLHSCLACHEKVREHLEPSPLNSGWLSPQFLTLEVLRVS